MWHSTMVGLSSYGSVTPLWSSTGLARMKMTSAAFIRALNPFSKSQSARTHAYWDRELKGYLSARRPAFVVCRGNIGDWPLSPAFSL